MEKFTVYLTLEQEALTPPAPKRHGKWHLKTSLYTLGLIKRYVYRKENNRFYVTNWFIDRSNEYINSGFICILC